MHRGIQAAVNIWEAKHVPYCLPEDYASFLSACNGMTMTWDLQYRGEVHKFGCVPAFPPFD